MEKEIRKSVEDFYAKAAVEPMEGLCCPTGYKEEHISHIPAEVMEIAYGCASPVVSSGIREGECMLDLGSGGGVDCFIGARLVGRGGRVIGVDMTDEMLSKARGASSKVASNLGYDVVEFRKGFLEEVPVEDETVDLVTSNCVINLSPDKGKVLGEIYRVLKHRGRFCISDVVAEGDVPESIRNDRRLWGECIAGALKEEDFIRESKKAGFYGLHITNRYLYREVEGLRFYSITLRGYKFKKSPECVYVGHFAIYNGPFKSVWDDDGHEYHAGVPVEVCTDTAETLKGPPYGGLFTVIENGKDGVEPVCCGTDDTSAPSCC